MMLYLKGYIEYFIKKIIISNVFIRETFTVAYFLFADKILAHLNILIIYSPRSGATMWLLMLSFRLFLCTVQQLDQTVLPESFS